MTAIPLAITIICYAVTCWGFFRQGQHALGFAFFFYACSNAAFLYIALLGSR